MNNTKIPRYIRLAYLIKLTQRRIIAGKSFAWQRQNMLVRALEREERELDVKGFLINYKIVRIA